jgi:hypothetical protein
MRTKEEALEHFQYKAPTVDTIPKFQAVTREFSNLVASLYDVMPDGPGKTLALRKLSEARMAVNSAIANDGQ